LKFLRIPQKKLARKRDQYLPQRSLRDARLMETTTAAQQKNWKDEGNAAFKVAKWGLAIKCYTTGIREDPHNHLLYSNRCAAWLKMSKDHKALEDAEKCIQLQPLWAKVSNPAMAAK
jgi:stress-induced-phosphoprotein 1